MSPRHPPSAIDAFACGLLMYDEVWDARRFECEHLTGFADRHGEGAR